MRRPWKHVRHWSFEPLEVRNFMSGDGIVEVAATASLSDSQSPASFPTFQSEEELRDLLLEMAVKQFEHTFGQRYEYNPWFLHTASIRAEDASSTNVQVAGIDETDLVETDGRHIFFVSNRQLTIVDTQSEQPLKVIAQIDLPEVVQGMYLSGTRLVLVSTRWDFQHHHAAIDFVADTIDGSRDVFFSPDDFMVGSHSGPKSIITVYDVSNPAEPDKVQATVVEGTLIDTRRIDDRLYMVSWKGLQLPQPRIIPDPPTVPEERITLFQPDAGLHSLSINHSFHGHYPVGGSQSGVYETKDDYLARVRNTIVDSVLPHFQSIGSAGQPGARTRLADANDVYRRDFATGGGLLSVSVFDLASPASAPEAVVVPAAWPRQVYMSHDNIYVVQDRWVSQTVGNQTEITQFSLIQSGSAVKLAAIGAVPGRIIDQFSLDEHDGYLRVVTERSPWDVAISSNLYVLKADGLELEIVGRLENLAPRERLFSSRFNGDRAFVVTFGPHFDPTRPQRPVNWVDPLFSIDVSDPTNPRLTGRLEIPGFSNYMQFVGGEHLIGLGRDADVNTGQWLSPQLSLFNIGDMANPQQVARIRLDELWGWSPAFSDHHAINYFADQKILAFPSGTDLLLFKVDPASATPLARHGTIELVAQTMRSVRIGSRLFSIAETYIEEHDLENPEIKRGLAYFGPLAYGHHARVDRVGSDHRLNVLEERQIPSEIWAGLRITAVTAPSQGGTVAIAADGRSLTYNPSTDLTVRYETFKYTVADEQGHTHTVDGSIYIAWDTYRTAMRAKVVAEMAALLKVPEHEITDHYWNGDYSRWNTTTEHVWKDNCLEAAAPGELCEPTPTPGFEFQLYYRGSKLVYRTGLTENIRLVSEQLEVAADTFELVENSTGNVLDVLQNDYLNVRHYKTPTIASVSSSTHGSVISISEDGQRLIYTPAEDFIGVEQFTYTLANGEQTTVKVRIPWTRMRDQMVLLARQDLAAKTGADLDEITLLHADERVYEGYVFGIPTYDGQQFVNRLIAGFDIGLNYRSKDVFYTTDTTDRVKITYAWGLILPDEVGIAYGSGEVSINVMSNDFPGPAGGISAVTNGEAGGQVRIGERRGNVLYTPPANFWGVDRFTYTVGDTTVTVTVTIAEPQPAAAANYLNAELPADVNRDGEVTPLDALLMINEINRTQGASFLRISEAATNVAISSLYCDPNADGYLTPADVLYVVNALNRKTADAARASQAQSSPLVSQNMAADVADAQPAAMSSSTPILIASTTGGADSGAKATVSLVAKSSSGDMSQLGTTSAAPFDSLPRQESGADDDELFSAIARDLIASASHSD